MTDAPSLAAQMRAHIRQLDARDHAAAPRIGGWFLCPCCKMPLLTAREVEETCPLCGWIDDGQDEAEADKELPLSPNATSLTAGRANFAKFTHVSGVATETGAARRAVLEYMAEVADGARLDLARFHALMGAMDE